MQAPPRTINAGQVIFLQALIFGCSLFGFRLLILALDYSTHMISSFAILLHRMNVPITTISLTVNAVFTSIDVFVALCFSFIAGLLAAQRTGKLGSGVLAGLWGGLLYGVLSLILGVIVVYTITIPSLPSAFRASASP